jgi:hypothetical protein
MSASTRKLFTGLIDDAAVFPPGNAPLDVAIDRHLAHRASPVSDIIGPLLVPVAAASDLLTLLDGRDSEHALGVGLIARPGTSHASLVDALALLTDDARVDVAAVEVPRGEDHDTALDDLAARFADGRDVIAKFRTGATPTWHWPDEAELANFIAAATERGVPFKLTGGLHHAVRADHPDSQHGLLNVLVAAQAGSTGSTPEHLAQVLEVRDPQALTALITGWDKSAVDQTRRRFTSYGCCEVTDPLTDLADLGLLTLE